MICAVLCCAPRQYQQRQCNVSRPPQSLSTHVCLQPRQRPPSLLRPILLLLPLRRRHPTPPRHGVVVVLHLPLLLVVVVRARRVELVEVEREGARAVGGTVAGFGGCWCNGGGGGGLDIEDGWVGVGGVVVG